LVLPLHAVAEGIHEHRDVPIAWLYAKGADIQGKIFWMMHEAKIGSGITEHNALQSLGIIATYQTKYSFSLLVLDVPKLKD
jgi:hypothetical protein